MHKNKSTLIIVMIIFFLTTACLINLGGPQYPETSIPVSPDALTSLQDDIKTAMLSANEIGQITLFITETQLTSFIADKLESQQDPIFTQPQAYLRDGQLRIFGTITRGFIQVTTSVIMTPGIDSSGKLSLELTSADFGPLPVPETLRQVVTSLVSEAYTGSLGPLATGFQLESVIIAEGAMMIIGRIK